MSIACWLRRELTLAFMPAIAMTATARKTIAATRSATTCSMSENPSSSARRTRAMNAHRDRSTEVFSAVWKHHLTAERRMLACRPVTAVHNEGPAADCHGAFVAELLVNKAPLRERDNPCHS